MNLPLPRAAPVGLALPAGINNMTVPAAIFRAYDIRGVVQDALTPAVVEQVGRALGSELFALGSDIKPQVVIARDGRLSSPELARALATGLQATGCDVLDVGLVPTPVLYYATHALHANNGIMITGSHNPPDYNGIKMVLNGQAIYGEQIQALYQRIQRAEFATGQGTYREVSIVDQYIQRIVGDVRLQRPLRLAIDCGNGAAGEVAVKLFHALGLEPVALYCEIDGTFPNHHPDPSKPENLQDLRAAIAEQDLELGLAFDGDGDRLGVIDASGNIIWPDRQMILYSQDILSRNPGSPIVYDVKCSTQLKNAILTAGGKPILSKTGHSLIKAAIRDNHAMLGGEMSGHIFFKERWFGFDDGLYAAVRLLEILSQDSHSPQQVFAALPNSVNTPELNISFAEGEHYQFIQRFIAAAQFPDAEIIDIDGLRAEFSDGWGLVRASNTTPSLVLRFEADNDAALQRIQDTFREQMLLVEPNLQLPF